MNQYLSDKIKIISFFSIILVLYIHSGFHDYPHEILGMKINHILQYTISGILGQCAVPIFYIISGYLFFLNTDKGIICIIKKIRKRIKTLFIPFIIACLFFPIFYLFLELIPGTDKYINSQNFSNNFQQPILMILQSIFYKTPGGDSPWAFQLWFLRDLIIIVASSPILFYLRQILRKEYIIILLYLISILPYNYFPIAACFWFMLGDAYLTKFQQLKLKWILPLLIFFSILELYTDTPFLITPIKLIGVICVWNLYDYIIPQTFKLAEHSFLQLLCGYTFFIYLYHEPTLNIIRKLIVVICGHTSLGFALSYLISPWIFSICAILIGSYLKKKIPFFYSIIVGGR